MKLNALQIRLSLLLLLAATPWARPQGTFVNLDFESANIPPGTPPGFVAASNALPGWTCYAGANQVTYVLYDTINLSDASISIHDANGTIPVLQGNYTLLLQASFPGGTVLPAFAQIGTIPATARSLLFDSGSFPPGVLFAGQQLGVVPLATTPTYTIFAADLTGLANQTGELRFRGAGLVDDISFSSQAIPEPGVFGLLGLGLVALSLTRRGWGR